MTEDKITREVAKRQDGLDSGAVRDTGYEELIARLIYRPSSLGK